MDNLGLNLSSQDLDLAIKRLCFFAPTGSGNYLRELNEFLALQSLAMLPSGLQSPIVIHRKITEILGTRFEFEEILDALIRLSHVNSVNYNGERPSDPSVTFALTIDKRNKLRDAVKEEEKLESEVINEWKKYLSQKYPKLNSSYLNDLVDDLKVFSFHLYPRFIG